MLKNQGPGINPGPFGESGPIEKASNYRMVKLRGTEWVTAPDVPTTMTVCAPGGLLWLLELLHPTPHSSSPSTSTTEPSAHMPVRRALLAWRWRLVAKTRPSKPNPVSDADRM